MQEEYSCCWLLLSPMRFLPPRSTRPCTHTTGLGAASPVGWKYPVQPQGESQLLSMSMWLDEKLLPSSYHRNRATALHSAFIFSPVLCFLIRHQMLTLLLSSVDLDHAAILAVWCNKGLQNIFTGGGLCSFKTKIYFPKDLDYFHIFTLNLRLSIFLCYGVLTGDDVLFTASSSVGITR